MVNAKYEQLDLMNFEANKDTAKKTFEEKEQQLLSMLKDADREKFKTKLSQQLIMLALAGTLLISILYFQRKTERLKSIIKQGGVWAIVEGIGEVTYYPRVRRGREGGKVYDTLRRMPDGSIFVVTNREAAKNSLVRSLKLVYKKDYLTPEEMVERQHTKVMMKALEKQGRLILPRSLSLINGSIWLTIKDNFLALFHNLKCRFFACQHSGSV